MTSVTLEIARSPASTAAGSLALQASILHDDATALREWRLLDQRLQNDSLSCSWDWVDTWIRYFGDLRHEYFVVREAGQIVGMSLLVKSNRRVGPFTDRRIHFGTAGEPDRDNLCVEYHRPLVAAQHFDGFFALLFQYLDQLAGWDTLHFDGLDGRQVPALLALKPPTIIRRIPSHYFDLKETRAAGQDVRDRLGSSTKQCLKANLKMFPDVRIEWSESLDHAAEMFEDLIRLHQERWTSVGQPGCFASQRFGGFHRELLRRWQPQGKFVLTRVRCGDQLLGCVQIFVERNRLLFYQCGSVRLSPKSSPGFLTDCLTIQQGLERGYDAYDFLAGDTTHKRKLSTHANEMVWLAWRRPRWKFQAMNALKSVKSWLRPQLKHPPTAPET